MYNTCASLSSSVLTARAHDKWFCLHGWTPHSIIIPSCGLSAPQYNSPVLQSQCPAQPVLRCIPAAYNWGVIWAWNRFFIHSSSQVLYICNNHWSYLKYSHFQSELFGGAKTIAFISCGGYLKGWRAQNTQKKSTFGNLLNKKNSISKNKANTLQ